jgi:formylglycine-generating enzyme required for sulfatase activity
MRESLLVAAFAALLATPASAVTIDWVSVGNAGNAADTPSTNCFAASCGSVAYDYQISKYEVTSAQYAEFLNAVDAGGSNTLELYDGLMLSTGIEFDAGGASGSKYVVTSGFANKPVGAVSFYDSLRFSNWLNNGQGGASTETGAYTLLGGTATPSNGLTVTRNGGANIFLPSENEWYKAAYYSPGGVYFDYPSGTDAATVCAAPTATANRANCSVAVGGVTNAGAYTNSASPYGTYDQGGNVREWNEQIVDGSARGIRGGSYIFSASSLAASSPGSSDRPDVGQRVPRLLGFPCREPRPRARYRTARDEWSSRSGATAQAHREGPLTSGAWMLSRAPRPTEPTHGPRVPRAGGGALAADGSPIPLRLPRNGGVRPHARRLAALMCSTLERHGVRVVLSGGSVVSIYSDNAYQSYDLDFIQTGRARGAAATARADRRQLFLPPAEAIVVDHSSSASLSSTTSSRRRAHPVERRFRCEATFCGAAFMTLRQSGVRAAMR